ncbi:MAG: Mut7-C RNAse domain-containing protein [Halanaeroarchaeum sp.]
MATPDDTEILLDVMCGGLRPVLRMVGYDTAYAMERGIEADDEIRSLADSEGRVLVTRDESLAERTPDAILLRSKETDEQLAELAAAGFELALTVPQRCSACNGRVVEVDPGETTPEYAPDPADRRCWRCRECGRVYWRGSHWDDVAERLRKI